MPKTIKTTYTAINLETGEVYTGIDAPQSITVSYTHLDVYKRQGGKSF